MTYIAVDRLIDTIVAMTAPDMSIEPAEQPSNS